MKRLLTSDGHEAAARTVAIIRVAVLPVLFLAERLGPHQEVAYDLFEATFAVAVIYALAALWWVFSERRGPPGWVVVGADFLLLCALTYETGGTVSELRHAFVLLPIGAVLLRRPRLTALCSLLALVAYLGILLTHPETDTAEVGLIVGFSLYIAWVGGVATLVSVMLGGRRERIDELRQRASRLVAQILDAEERERRQLAEALHEDALQNVLAARQDVAAAEEGDLAGLAPARMALDRTIEQIRHEVFPLYPRALEYAGLTAALRVIADNEARRGGFSVALKIDPTAHGVDDGLVFSLVRELLINAAKHAAAANVYVGVRRADEVIVVEVQDDGRGFDEQSRRAALREGHIGLASTRERVEALGGSWHVWTRPGSGTRVRMTIPIEHERRRVGRSRSPAARPESGLTAVPGN